MDKLHLGCGNEILSDWVNHDLVALPGVDVTHDLTVFPWPFASSSFSKIRMFHVLEHLPDTIKTMEELHRIAAPGAEVNIRVPYWNSPDMITDPTHRVFFNQYSFEYFDPGERHCRERPYYSTARFKIQRKYYFTKFLGDYQRISSPLFLRLLESIATYLGGVIWVMEIELVAMK